MRFHLTGTITDLARVPAFREEEIRVTHELQQEGVIVSSHKRERGLNSGIKTRSCIGTRVCGIAGIRIQPPP